MPAGMLRTIAVMVLCFSNTSFAVAGERPRHASATIQGAVASSRSTDASKARLRAPSPKRHVARTLAADRDPYADPAAPYKANRFSFSSPPGAPIIDIPGQTTVLTRQTLDDLNATTLRDALRSTAGVTVGR
jgi:outer membrane receptor for monomeric catechols